MLKLFNLEVYILARKISKLAWFIINKLPGNYRYHPGNQFIRSVDSVGANISEGYGRYGFKDKIRFCIIARGSLFESIHWIEILLEQKLISIDLAKQYKDLAFLELKMLNNYIKFLKNKSNTFSTN